MCGATKGGPSLDGVDLTKETVIQGIVTNGGEPVDGAYVRLHNATGEFTAEVPTSATGQFRFFAAPGDWSLSVLHKDGKGSKDVKALGPGLIEASLTLS